MRRGHAHSKATGDREATASGRHRPGWSIGIALVAVLVVAVGATAVAVHDRNPSADASSATGKDAVSTAASTTFKVVSVSPASGASAVPSDATIVVQLSAPIKAGSPTPSLSPAVPGLWEQVTPTAFEFVPSGPLVPSSTVTVTVPGGKDGLASTNGRSLHATTTAQFTVAVGSVLRLQQLLAQLQYLPLSFTPAGAVTSPQEAAQPQEGTFAWRNSEPASLTGLWTQGTENTITEGAVMAFEAQHDLTTDGIAGPAVWQDLLSDAASGALDPNPYNYVFVSESLPETATVYSNGSEVYSTKANTGVAGAPTASGTFPVYLRYKVTTMSGTNPDGSTYVDPGIPWVSYFNGGDALHGFVRAGYGWPQSDGCVEMPPANAAVVYPLTPIGTLVTVS